MVAVGQAGMITADTVKPGSVVIDVGINRVEVPGGKAKLVGDVDFASVRTGSQCHYGRVPGGVGPMTVAMLLENTVTSYRKRVGL